MKDNKLIQQGWECPKCGSVYSPITSKCVVCPQVVNLTSGTSTSGTTFICTQFLGDGLSTTVTRCMKCGKLQYQHPIISSTL